MRVLYQFPISHFCEKARWNLDAKALPFVVRDVPPGLHRWLLPRGGKRKVPLLADEGFVVQDSAAIAAYLDERYGAPRLLPGGGEAARVLELERYFGQIGHEVRRVAYGAMLARPGVVAEALFAPYPLPARALGRAFGGRIEGVIRKQYEITDATRASSWAALLEGLDRIERETGCDPGRYLVGDRLSIADISAAALLAPVVASPGSPYAPMIKDAGAELTALRDSILARPAVAWIDARYARDRQAKREG